MKVKTLSCLGAVASDRARGVSTELHNLGEKIVTLTARELNYDVV